MRVLATLPQDDLAAVPAAATAAEAAGHDGAVTSENRNDPFVALGVAAVHTRRSAWPPASRSRSPGAPWSWPT